MSTPWALAIGVGLLAANGFFVAAEFALLAARRSRIQTLAEAGERRARSALAGLRELSVMLAGAQLGITAASLGLGAVAEPAIAHLLEDVLEPLGVPEAALHTIAFSIALSVVVFMHMVVGEMAPKSWAIAHPERSAIALAPFFRAYVVLFRPVIRVLNAIANAVVRLCGVTPQDERAMAHSPADLRLLLEESSAHGTLADTHAQLLSRTLQLSERDAVAAMTPRRQIVSVSADATVDDIEHLAAQQGLSRLLVRDGDLDHAIGVVHVRDTLVLDDTARQRRLARDLASPLLPTPESHALDDLLADMRRDHRHFAVVIDELGVVAGIVRSKTSSNRSSEASRTNPTNPAHASAVPAMTHGWLRARSAPTNSRIGPVSWFLTATGTPSPATSSPLWTGSPPSATPCTLQVIASKSVPWTTSPSPNSPSPQHQGRQTKARRQPRIWVHP